MKNKLTNLMMSVLIGSQRWWEKKQTQKTSIETTKTYGSNETNGRISTKNLTLKRNLGNPLIIFFADNIRKKDPTSNS